jgi:hypothetical protein
MPLDNGSIWSRRSRLCHAIGPAAPKWLQSRGTGWTVSVTAPIPVVRDGAFSCPWPARVFWNHGRTDASRTTVARDRVS